MLGVLCVHLQDAVVPVGRRLVGGHGEYNTIKRDKESRRRQLVVTSNDDDSSTRCRRARSRRQGCCDRLLRVILKGDVILPYAS